LNNLFDLSFVQPSDKEKTFLYRVIACNFFVITPYPFRSVYLSFAGWDMLTGSMSGYTCGGKTVTDIDASSQN